MGHMLADMRFSSASVAQGERLDPVTLEVVDDLYHRGSDRGIVAMMVAMGAGVAVVVLLFALLS